MLRLNKHEDKYCSQCSEVFTCKAGDIMNCQCTEIKLNDETRKFLEKTYYDCLCKKCLVAIDQELKIAKSHIPPQ